MCRPSEKPSTATTEYYLKAPLNNKPLLSTTTTSENNSFLILIVLPLLSYISFKFSSILPSLFSPSYAHLHYIPANWNYTEADCHFCNSIWTWGTDYLLAIFMARNAYLCLQSSKGTTPQSSSLRRTAAAIFTLYCISVLSGGIAHQYYRSVEELNSFSFRVLWFTCVATVGMAGGIIGVMGSKLGKYHNVEEGKILPESFWRAYGVIMVLACAMGSMSYNRPACDIFMAGTTQCAPTFYNIWIMFNIYFIKQQQANKQVSVAMKHSIKNYLKYSVSYLLNAPPLPIYTLLLNAQIATPIINTYLHINLFLCWNFQGYFIRYFIELFEEGL